MNVKEYKVFLTAGAPRVELSAVGSMVRCVDAPALFGLSIDGGQELPFGVGRSIKLEGGRTFSNLALVWNNDTLWSGTLEIRIVVAGGVENYEDSRVAFFSGAGMRVAGAADMVSQDFVHAAPGMISVGAQAGQFLANVRNTHATETLRVGCSGVLGSAAITAGVGLIIEPGENADIPLGLSEANPSGVSLRIYAAAGTTYTVTWFVYDV
jgi:hypothetical protein